MLKKNLILCLLLFFYAIVLGHSAIPHGHFDEFFHTDDDHDSQEHHHQDHHFLFSHSISLHVAIEKQSIFSAHPLKSSNKNAQPDTLFYASSFIAYFGLQSSFIFLRSSNSKSPTLGCYKSVEDRGPPVLS